MMNECYSCGFWDSERSGCTCPLLDMWYACPVESELPENKKALEDYAEWAGKENDDKMNKRDALKELIDDLSDPKEGMIITLYADKHARNVFAYLEDKYDQTPTQLINRALMGFYAEDIKELERKEE